jgi:isoprenylcysteine carboxyl methyltransferase (ICMT) family protein YpbQ
MAAARLAEISYSRRNITRSGATEEGIWSARTFPLIVAVHTCVIAGTAVFGRGRPRLPWLALSLPLAFGLGALALAATATNVVLLAGRIREEEAALFRLPGYSEHFRDKRRFIPYLF